DRLDREAARPPRSAAGACTCDGAFGLRSDANELITAWRWPSGMRKTKRGAGVSGAAETACAVLLYNRRNRPTGLPGDWPKRRIYCSARADASRALIPRG